jgi:hypothetical protein
VTGFVNADVGALRCRGRELFATSGRDVLVGIGELYQHRSSELRHPANGIERCQQRDEFLPRLTF